jgi:hypothetical protein
MEELRVRGVVRNGQVVVETPLNLPDGSFVIVTEYNPADDPDAPGPPPPTPEARREMMIGLTGRLDLVDDPDWETKILMPLE